jgi:hypothetical protein
VTQPATLQRTLQQLHPLPLFRKIFERHRAEQITEPAARNNSIV